MARRKIVAGNWKMNMTPSQALALVEELKPLVANEDVDVVFCVPAIDVVPVAEAVKGTNIQVGAQNMYFEEKGAYTGEISPAMLTDAGIIPIICCGESLTQREQGITIDWVRQQIKIAFQQVSADQAKTAVIAYEPIWAIGTGKVATTEQAEEVCGAIRACIGEIYDEATAEAIRIQYGGSVSGASAPELFAQPDIDGGLVGGASLKADFGKIVNYDK